MVETGKFRLHSNFMPPVTAGDYELESEPSGTGFDGDTETTTTNVRVTAPRFAMPIDQILSSFPPANAEGAFGDRLPQIVLRRRTLPWERNPTGDVFTSDIPWLALVVLAEAEAELSTPTDVADCTTADIIDPDDRDVEQGIYLAVTETVVAKVFPTADDLPLLTHVREVDVTDTELSGGDDDGWVAVVLANRLPVADEANGTAVRYLACLVNLEGHLDSLPKAPDLPHVDTFLPGKAQDWSQLAVVTDQPDVWVGGGFDPETIDLNPDPLDPIDPIPGAPPLDPSPSNDVGRPDDQLSGPGMAPSALSASARHQIDGAGATRSAAAADSWAISGTAATRATDRITAAAQDPDAARLVRSAMTQGFQYPISQYANEPVLRFPVLAHWSFTTNTGDTFETLLRDLDVGLLGTAAPVDDAAPPAPASSTSVASGHLRLDHRTRRGDTATAWYRGPLVPHPLDRGAIVGDRVAHASDQLRRVVPDGREDLTYAAAFEIGRLLGLSQLSVVGALLRFRRDQFGAARLQERAQWAVPFDLDDVLIESGDGADLGHLLSRLVVEQIGQDPVRVAGPRRPVADPGRPIPGLGGLSAARLDAVVAEGLGIDLERLTAQAERIGVVAALAETEVPVAPIEEAIDDLGEALRTRLRNQAIGLAATAFPQEAGGKLDPEDPLGDLERRLEGRPTPAGEDD